MASDLGMVDLPTWGTEWEAYSLDEAIATDFHQDAALARIPDGLSQVENLGEKPVRIAADTEVFLDSSIDWIGDSNGDWGDTDEVFLDAIADFGGQELAYLPSETGLGLDAFVENEGVHWGEDLDVWEMGFVTPAAFEQHEEAEIAFPSSELHGIDDLPETDLGFLTDAYELEWFESPVEDWESEFIEADLYEAELFEAELFEAELFEAELFEAELFEQHGDSQFGLFDSFLVDRFTGGVSSVSKFESEVVAIAENPDEFLGVVFVTTIFSTPQERTFETSTSAVIGTADLAIAAAFSGVNSSTVAPGTTASKPALLPVDATPDNSSVIRSLVPVETPPTQQLVRSLETGSQPDSYPDAIAVQSTLGEITTQTLPRDDGWDSAGSTAMNAGLRALGQAVLHERLSVLRSVVWSSHQLTEPGKKPHEFATEASQGATYMKGVFSAARQPTAVQLYVGEPIEPLSGLNAFNIFEALAVVAGGEILDEVTDDESRVSANMSDWPLVGIWAGMASSLAYLTLKRWRESESRKEPKKRSWVIATDAKLPTSSDPLDKTCPAIVRAS